MPARCASRSARTSSATEYPTSRSNRAAEPPRAAGTADVDRAADHLAGEDDVRPAFGGRGLAVVVRAADVDLYVVDRGARTIGKPQIQPAELHVELDDDDRSGETRPRQIEVHRTHPPVQGQPGRHDPLPLAFE